MIWVLKYQIKKDKIPQRIDLEESWGRRSHFMGVVFMTLRFLPTKIIAVFLWALLNSGFAFFYPKKEIYYISWSKAEKKNFKRFKELAPQIPIIYLDWNFGFRKFIGAIQLFCFLLFSGKLGKVFSLAQRLARREQFIIAARALEALLSTMYFQKKSNKESTYLVSSDSNPHATSLFYLARKKSIKTIFIAHSPWIENPLAISLQGGIFWGPSGYSQFVEKGARIENRIFISPQLQLTKLKDQKNNGHILIALSKTFKQEALDSLLLSFSSHKQLCYNKIRIRPHPNSLFKLSQSYLLNASYEEDLNKALDGVSYVVAGNSTIHLEALARGVPSFFSDSLMESKDEKTLPFIKEGLVRPLSDLFGIENSIFLYSNQLMEKIREEYYYDMTKHRSNESKAVEKFIDGIHNEPI